MLLSEFSGAYGSVTDLSSSNRICLFNDKQGWHVRWDQAVTTNGSNFGIPPSVIIRIFNLSAIGRLKILLLQYVGIAIFRKLKTVGSQRRCENSYIRRDGRIFELISKMINSYNLAKIHLLRSAKFITTINNSTIILLFFHNNTLVFIVQK